jgi:hypothetical protein
MNGYVAFYGCKRVELHADTLYEAKQKVIKMLRVPKHKEYSVAVVLAEKDGEQVTHTPDF